MKTLIYLALKKEYKLLQLVEDKLAEINYPPMQLYPMD
jgi:hypothetical protein